MCLCSKVLQNMDLPDALGAAADIGYRAVELFGIERHLPPDSPPGRTKELAALLSRRGLEAASLCTYVGGFDALDDEGCAKQMEDFKRHLEQAEVLDAPWLRVNPTYLGYERPASQDEVKRFAEWTARCADLAAESGRGVCLENNLSMIGTVNGTIEVLNEIHRENVVVTYDPGNIIRIDRENFGRNAVRTLGDRIAILQVKQIDMSLTDLEDPKCFVFYDEGGVDYDEVYREIAGSSALKYLSVECHKPPGKGMSERDVAAREYELIRRHAGKYLESLV